LLIALFLLAEPRNFAFMNAPRCRTTQGLVRFLYAGQQVRVSAQVERSAKLRRW
jgi:hypothetical protein